MTNPLVTLAQQWRVFVQAPELFISVWIALAVAAYLIARWRYAGTIDTLRERLSLRDDQIARLKGRQEEPPSPSPKADSQPAERLPTTSTKEPPSGTNAKAWLPDNVTPKFISDLFEGKTNFQAEQETRHFLGKWMKYCGEVENVSLVNKGLGSVHFRGSRFIDSITAYFRSDIEKLGQVKVGSLLEVVGQVDRIKRVGIELENCEIVDHATL